MLSNLTNLPKTNAGQLFRNYDGVKIIKERLTSYGSIAIIKFNGSYVVIKYDYNAKVYGFIVCGLDITKITNKWNDSV